MAAEAADRMDGLDIGANELPQLFAVIFPFITGNKGEPAVTVIFHLSLRNVDKQLLFRTPLNRLRGNV